MTDKKWTAQSDSDGYWEVIEKGEESDLLIADLASEEDALLIAAAPETAIERDQLKAINAELVYALKEYQLANPIHNDSEAQLYDLAKAAIAKAEAN